jgi:pimeloyl-ACP methyl ester carboxylesterase
VAAQTPIKLLEYLDLAHAAIIGHGFGGTVALNVAASDSRFVGGSDQNWTTIQLIE